MKKITMCFLLLTTTVWVIFGQKDSLNQSKSESIHHAIQLASDYAAEVLINAEGKSRCDYDILAGQWREYEPAWHTGQVMYGLLKAYEVTKDSTHLAAAIRGGEWWKTLEIKNHTTLTGYIAAVHGGDIEDPLINFTTIADGTPGIFELSRVTGDPSYADVATKGGQWAIDHLFIPEHGLIYDLVDVNTGEIWNDKSPHFSDDVKLTIHDVARPNNEGFLYADMYLHTDEKQYLDFFKTLCNSLVEKQSDNGFWMDYHPNNVVKAKIHPRFNIWNAESLLVGYRLTGEQKYLDAALATARAIVDWQQKDGAMYYTNRPDGSYDSNSICGSAVAFAGLLWLELRKYGYIEFDAAIEQSLSFVLNNQFPTDHPDPNLRGAFLETWSKTSGGERIIYIRDIATSFGLRFLAAYLQSDIHE